MAMPSSASAASMGSYHTRVVGACTPSAARTVAEPSRMTCAPMAAVRPTVRAIEVKPSFANSTSVPVRTSRAPSARRTSSSWCMMHMSRSPSWYFMSSLLCRIAQKLSMGVLACGTGSRESMPSQAMHSCRRARSAGVQVGAGRPRSTVFATTLAMTPSTMASSLTSPLSETRRFIRLRRLMVGEPGESQSRSSRSSRPSLAKVSISLQKPA
mmetsp:Transcript_29737/g.82999  ORF Transcript_29737/g.82999 Transcript_29737/m.82999 type:complete len:212 (+) Transcript_29737:114-749(+)